MYGFAGAGFESRLKNGGTSRAQPAGLVRILPEVQKKQVVVLLDRYLPFFSGTPGPIRTGGLRIRSPALYPAELRAHVN